MADLNWPAAYDIKPDPNVSEVRAGDRLVAKVHFVPSTVGHVYFIEIFDHFDNLVQRTDYDERGFKARDEFFSSGGRTRHGHLSIDQMVVGWPNSIIRMIIMGLIMFRCAILSIIMAVTTTLMVNKNGTGSS
jgi:hypothetical protein